MSALRHLGHQHWINACLGSDLVKSAGSTDIAQMFIFQQPHEAVAKLHLESTYSACIGEDPCHPVYYSWSWGLRLE